MKLDDVQIDSQAVTVKTAGKGYAYIGGFIDLDPWNAKEIVVEHDVEIRTYDHVEEIDFDTWPAAVEFESDGSSIRRTIRLSTRTGPKGPSIRDLFDLAVRYEWEQLAPPGFAEALRDWFIEQGVGQEVFA